MATYCGYSNAPAEYAMKEKKKYLLQLSTINDAQTTKHYYIKFSTNTVLLNNPLPLSRSFSKTYQQNILITDKYK